MFRFAHALRRGSTAMLAVAVLAFAASPASAQIIRTETGSTAGVTTLVPQALAKFAAREGLQIQINADQTLTKSAMKLGAGQIEMAVVPPSAFRAMQTGTGPYAQQAEAAKKLAGDLRLLFGFIGGHIHTIVWADSGMKSYADFKGKRVFIGPPAGAANAQLSGLVKVASGLEAGKDYEPVRLGWGAANQAFQDGQMDVMLRPAAVGSAEIAQLALQRAIRIISLPEEATKGQAWEAYLDRFGDFAGKIPAGTYQGQVNSDETILTTAYGMQLAAHKSMDEETAYKLTKVFWDNIDEVRSTSALLKSMDAATPLIGANVPLHPGAARYFKERGVVIPAKLAAPDQ